MKLKGAIFDLDGTLLDSMHVWLGLGNAYMRHKGLSADDSVHDVLKPMSLVQAARHFQANYGIQLSEAEIISEFLALAENAYYNEVQLKDGVEEFLYKLRQANVKMCIATATERHLAEAALKRLGIYNWFCGMVTCTEARAGKDYPDIYHMALKLLGTRKASTLVFEDALYAIKTAKKAGFKVAGVFDASFRADKAQIVALSDFFIESYSDCTIL